MRDFIPADEFEKMLNEMPSVDHTDNNEEESSYHTGDFIPMNKMPKTMINALAEKWDSPFSDFRLQLDEEDSQKFEAWRSKLPKNLQSNNDYDLERYWYEEEKNSGDKTPKFIQLNDKYQLPNHPTFSTKSIFNNNPDLTGGKSYEGGRWVTDKNGERHFYASKHNIQNMPYDDLVNEVAKIDKHVKVHNPYKIENYNFLNRQFDTVASTMGSFDPEDKNFNTSGAVAAAYQNLVPFAKDITWLETPSKLNALEDIRTGKKASELIKSSGLSNFYKKLEDDKNAKTVVQSDSSLRTDSHLANALNDGTVDFDFDKLKKLSDIEKGESVNALINESGDSLSELGLEDAKKIVDVKDKLLNIAKEAGIEEEKLAKIKKESTDIVDFTENLKKAATDSLLTYAEVKRDAAMRLEANKANWRGKIINGLLTNIGYVGEFALSAGSMGAGTAIQVGLGTASEYMQNTTKEYFVGRDGKLIVRHSDDSGLLAMLNAGGSKSAEVAIERLTDKGIELALNKVPGGKVIAGLKPTALLIKGAKKFLKNGSGIQKNIIKGANTFTKIGKTTGINGIGSEWFEEVEDGFVHQGLGLGERTIDFDLAKSLSAFGEEVKTLDYHADIFWGLIGTMLAQGGGALAYEHHKFNDTYKDAVENLKSTGVIEESKIKDLSKREVLFFDRLRSRLQQVSPEQAQKFADRISDNANFKDALFTFVDVNKPFFDSSRDSRYSGVEYGGNVVQEAMDSGKVKSLWEYKDDNWKNRGDGVLVNLDEDNGIALVDFGEDTDKDGVTTHHISVLNNDGHAYSVSGENLEDAKEKAIGVGQRMSIHNQLLEANRVQKRVFIEDQIKKHNKRDNFVVFDTLADVKNAIPYIENTKGFHPENAAFHLEDGKIGLVVDNVRHAFEVDKLITHESLHETLNQMFDNDETKIDFLQSLKDSRVDFVRNRINKMRKERGEHAIDWVKGLNENAYLDVKDEADREKLKAETKLYLEESFVHSFDGRKTNPKARDHFKNWIKDKLSGSSFSGKRKLDNSDVEVLVDSMYNMAKIENVNQDIVIRNSEKESKRINDQLDIYKAFYPNLTTRAIDITGNNKLLAVNNVRGVLRDSFKQGMSAEEIDLRYSPNLEDRQRADELSTVREEAEQREQENKVKIEKAEHETKAEADSLVQAKEIQKVKEEEEIVKEEEQKVKEEEEIVKEEEQKVKEEEEKENQVQVENETNNYAVKNAEADENVSKTDNVSVDNIEPKAEEASSKGVKAENVLKDVEKEEKTVTPAITKNKNKRKQLPDTKTNNRKFAYDYDQDSDEYKSKVAEGKKAMEELKKSLKERRESGSLSLEEKAHWEIIVAKAYLDLADKYFPVYKSDYIANSDNKTVQLSDLACYEVLNKFRSKDPNRIVLQGIYFAGDEVVATDASKLAISKKFAHPLLDGEIIHGFNQILSVSEYKGKNIAEKVLATYPNYKYVENETLAYHQVNIDDGVETILNLPIFPEEYVKYAFTNKDDIWLFPSTKIEALKKFIEFHIDDDSSIVLTHKQIGIAPMVYKSSNGIVIMMPHQFEDGDSVYNYATNTLIATESLKNILDSANGGKLTLESIQLLKNNGITLKNAEISKINSLIKTITENNITVKLKDPNKSLNSIIQAESQNNTKQPSTHKAEQPKPNKNGSTLSTTETPKESQGGTLTAQKSRFDGVEIDLSELEDINWSSRELSDDTVEHGNVKNTGALSGTLALVEKDKKVQSYFRSSTPLQLRVGGEKIGHSFLTEKDFPQLFKNSIQKTDENDNSVNWSSRELSDDEVITAAVKTQKIIKQLIDKNFNKFEDLAEFIATKKPKLFVNMKPYLTKIWNYNAGDDNIDIDVISKKDAREIISRIENDLIKSNMKGDINNESMGQSGRSGTTSSGTLDGEQSTDNAKSPQEKGVGQESGRSGISSTTTNLQTDGRVGSESDVGDNQGRSDSDSGRPNNDTTVGSGNGTGGKSSTESSGHNQFQGGGTDSGTVGRNGAAGGQSSGESNSSGTKSTQSRLGLSAVSEDVKEAAKKAAEEKSNPNTPKDFVINDEVKTAVLESNPLKRIENNVLAIRTMKKVLAEDRSATQEEQTIMAKYVGWGGLSEVFSRNYVRADYESKNGTPQSVKEELNSAKYGEKGYAYNQELRSILSSQEFSGVAATVTTAFYTPFELVQLEHKALRSIGVKGGRFLSPSAGVGNYVSSSGEYARQLNWKLVEKDSVTGNILKLLFPNQNVTIGGFEDAKIADNFYDVAIDNVPYAEIGIDDESISKRPMMIHDYFFAKTLKKLRYGGVMMFLTSTGSLDKATNIKTDDSGREDVIRPKYAANPALMTFLKENGGQIIGAVRLPNGMFSKNANTDVACDLIVVQKTDSKVNNSAFEDIYKEGGAKQNAYFRNHPANIIGESKLGTNKYGAPAFNYKMPKGDLWDYVETALYKVMTNVDQEALTRSNTNAVKVEQNKTIVDNEGLAQGNITIQDGKIYIKSGDSFDPVSLPSKPKGYKKATDGMKVIKDIITIRKALRDVVNAQVKNYDDEVLQQCLVKLNDAYDTFFSKYGSLNDKYNKQLCLLDLLDGNRLLALENKVEDVEASKAQGKKVYKLVKADIFSKRVVYQGKLPTKANDINEALMLSFGTTGAINTEYMANLLSATADEVEKQLKDTRLAFVDPETGTLTPKWEYLSGRVRNKLDAAKAAVEEGDKSFTTNIEELEKVQPKDVDIKDVSIRFGAPWIDVDCMKDFLLEALGARNSDYITLTKSEVTGRYNLIIRYDAQSPWGEVSSRSKYGALCGFIETVLNKGSLAVYYTQPNGSKVLNQTATDNNNIAAESLHSAFEAYVRSDGKWADKMQMAYNYAMNNIVQQTLPFEMLPFKQIGISEKFLGYLFENGDITRQKKGREYQTNVISRGVFGNQNLLLAHCVGAGKTLEMQSIGMIGKYLGKFNKPMYVVPNHMLEQFATEFVQAFPNANVLKMNNEDVHPDNRRAFFARVANGNWDAIIVKHSTFSQKLPMSKDYKVNFIQDKIKELENALALSRSDGNRITVKEIQKSIETFQTNLNKLLDEKNKDFSIVPFEELGVDQLFVDEAHNFKGMLVKTKMANVKGLTGTTSNRAADMEMKTSYISNIRNNKGGIVFATGTPLSNAPAIEAYIMLQYLAPNNLRNQGILDFDGFIDAFGKISDRVEFANDGVTPVVKSAITGFTNIPEMMKLFKAVTDIVNSGDLKDVKRPTPKVITIPVEMTKTQAILMERIGVSSLKKSTDKSKFIVLANCAKRLMTCPALIGINDFGMKIQAIVNNVKKVYDEEKDNLGTQLIFNDMFNSSASYAGLLKRHINLKDVTTGVGINMNKQIKQLLVESGIPENEIFIMQDIPSSKKDTIKEEVFEKVRNGEIRVLLGSRALMGEGTNVQTRLAAIHLVHPGWKPSEDEQAIGRIIRAGNMYDEGKIFYYMTQGNEQVGSYETKNHQMVLAKSKLISEVLHNKSDAREIETDDDALDKQVLMQVATNNPLVLERLEVQEKVNKLRKVISSKLTYANKKLDQVAPAKEKLNKEIVSTNKDIEGMHKWREANQDKPFVLITSDNVALEKPGEIAKYLEERVVGELSKARYEQKETVELGTVNGVSVFHSHDKYNIDKNSRIGIPLIGYARNTNAKIMVNGMAIAPISPQFVSTMIKDIGDRTSLEKEQGILDALETKKKQIELLTQNANQLKAEASEAIEDYKDAELRLRTLDILIEENASLNEFGGKSKELQAVELAQQRISEERETRRHYAQQLNNREVSERDILFSSREVDKEIEFSSRDLDDVMSFNIDSLNSYRRANGLKELPKTKRVTADQMVSEGHRLASNERELNRLVRVAAQTPQNLTSAQLIALKEKERRLRHTWEEQTKQIKEAIENNNYTQAQYLQSLRFITEDNFSELNKAWKQSASEWGRAGRARQMVFDYESGDFATFMLHTVAETGRKLSAEEEKLMRQLFDGYIEAKGKLDAESVRKTTELLKGAFKKIAEKTEQETRNKSATKIDQEYDAAIDHIIVHSASHGGVLYGLPQGKKWLMALCRYHMNEAMLEGRKLNYDEIVSKIHNDIDKYVSCSDHDILQMITSHGTTIEQSDEPLEVALREMRMKMNEYQKLEDMLVFGHAPQVTGMMRDKQSLDVRNMTQEVRDAYKQFVIDHPEILMYEDKKRIKSIQETLMNRMKNEIEALAKAIETGERLQKESKSDTPYTADMEYLRQRLLEMRKEYKEMFPPIPLTHEEMVAKVQKLLKRRLEKLNMKREALENAETQEELESLLSREKKEGVQDPSLDKLREEIDQVKGQIASIEEMNFPEGTMERFLKALTNRKDALNRNIERIQDKIATQNFAPQKKEKSGLQKRVESDPEIIRLTVLRNQAVRRLQQERDIFKRSNQPFNLGGKVDYLKAILSLPRVIRASIDLSSVCIQGALMTGRELISNPKAVAKAILLSAKSFSEKYGDEITKALMNDPDYQEFIDMGGHIYTTSDLDMRDVPEEFRDIELKPFTFNGKRYGVEDIPGVKASERAFGMYLNLLAINSYKTLKANPAFGATGPNEYDKRDIAKFINIANGRGFESKGKKVAQSAMVDMTFWAARLATASLRQATAITMIALPFSTDGATMQQRDMVSRKATLKVLSSEYAKGMSGLLILSALVTLALGSKDPEDIEEMFDPRSSNFLSPKIGNTHISFLPMKQWWTLFTRLATGQQRGMDGVVRDVDPERLVWRFIRGKLAPIPGLITDIVSGKDFLGDELVQGGVENSKQKNVYLHSLESLGFPLAIKDIYDSAKNNDPFNAVMIMPFIVLGAAKNTIPDNAVDRQINQYKDVSNKLNKILKTKDYTTANEFVKENLILRNKSMFDAKVKEINRLKRQINDLYKSGKVPSESLLKRYEEKQQALAEAIKKAKSKE